MEAIRSASNPLVKRARAVRRGREPGLLFLEGAKLCDEALSAGFRPEILFVSEGRGELLEAYRSKGVEAKLLAAQLFESLGTLVSAADVLGLFEVPAGQPLAALPSAPDSLVVISAGLQDPGNLGGLARSAEALGAEGLIVLPEGCRPWNEKALRGSMGSLLRIPVFEPDPMELLEALKASGFRHVVARTRGGTSPADFDWGGRIALWITAETGELSPSVAGHSSDWNAVTIPMTDKTESLNVAVAASILLFSAKRVGARGVVR